MTAKTTNPAPDLAAELAGAENAEREAIATMAEVEANLADAVSRSAYDRAATLQAELERSAC